MFQRAPAKAQSLFEMNHQQLQMQQLPAHRSPNESSTWNREQEESADNVLVDTRKQEEDVLC